MRQLNSRLAATCGRYLLRLLIGLYIILVLGVLGVRYGLPPLLQHGQGYVQDHLSRALGADVHWDRLAIRWQGFRPRIDMRNVRLRSHDGRDLLTIPSVHALVDWPAWRPDHPGVLHLQTRGVALHLVRLPGGQLDIPLANESGSADDEAVSDAALRWLLSQPMLEFRDATLRWADHTRDGTELALEGVDLTLRRQPDGGVGVSLAAQTAAVPQAHLSLRATLADATALARGQWPSSWQAWMRLQGSDAAVWRSWLDVPQALHKGSLDVQFWGQSSASGPRVTVLLQSLGLVWQPQKEGRLQVADLQAWGRSSLATLRVLGREGHLRGPLDFQVRTHGAILEAPAWFDHDLQLGAIEARGQLTGHLPDLDAASAATVAVDVAEERPTPDLILQLDQFRWLNPDISVRGQGHWASGPGAGQAELGGRVERAELAALHRYLPLEVDEDARAWLAEGLRQGELREADWRLRGDIAEFPFGDRPDAGDFHLAGQLVNATVDLVPDATAAERWPLLEQIRGRAELHRTDLRLQGERAVMQPAPGDEWIHLNDIDARIPDLENDTTLEVSGQARASGQTWMSFMRHSPVGDMLQGLFSEARATGQWQVPLSLTVPLLHSIDTQVHGQVQFSGPSSVRFLPEVPQIDAIAGRLDFDENGVTMPAPLKARFLGGELNVTGALGPAQAPGLKLHGTMAASALRTLADVPGMQRISGSLAWKALLRRTGHGYHLGLESELQDMKLDFPAPLAKPLGEAMPLQIDWSDAANGRESLDVRLGSALDMRLTHRPDAPRKPYFEQAAIGLGRAAAEPVAGLTLDVAYPLVDLDAWDRIANEFSAPGAPHAGPGLWPDLVAFSVRADQLRLLGTRLDQATLRAVRAQGGQWSVNLRSDQTRGTIKWQAHEGQVQGRVNAHFDRLSLGDDPGDTGSLLPTPSADIAQDLDDDVFIPAITLQVEDFRLYGHALGPLALEGEQDRAGKIWTLGRLRIGPAGTQLQGTGVWRLQGADRGLSIKARMDTDNLGAWMDHAGWSGVLVGGQGEIQGHFDWRNLPWRREVQDIDGELTLSLDKGRFPQVDSRSAKLLEVFSLQSVSRLFRLEGALTGLMREGLPFDQLRGTLRLDRGLARMQDYKMIGPVGTLILDGSADVIEETMDLQAVVVPNLDASGASVAAGIAVNPLVGLGAFVTQWLLKDPLARAMTRRYAITGPWEDPQLEEVSLSSKP
ncbi:YhdP family protein [Castellaniella sp.]|uniref:YhdP family protein n=1 Tax=Castellaniella sp. TaxID=1955812 RepID=UPI00355FDA2A